MAGTWSASRRAPLVALACAVTVALALAPAADAANRRVSIGDYRWSQSEVQIDLGEHVTWYWTGPDTAHSVTGDSANTRGLDSDPGVNLPNHRLGDSFRLDFDSPGTYAFVCKVHSIVAGKVVVSATPGDPESEPDPVPVTFVDDRAPRIRDPRLAARRIRARGTSISLSLGERARLDAEYYRLQRDGERVFAGYEAWRGFIGLNRFRFGGRAPHFRARPGRYVALLRATDRSNNISRPRLMRFEIVPGHER
jgi:plastocyanin